MCFSEFKIAIQLYPPRIHNNPLQTSMRMMLLTWIIFLRFCVCFFMSEKKVLYHKLVLEASFSSNSQILGKRLWFPNG